MTRRLTYDQRVQARIIVATYMIDVEGMDSREAAELVSFYTEPELASTSKYYRRQPEFQALLKPEWRTS